jgi:hypothetical protein
MEDSTKIFELPKDRPHKERPFEDLLLEAFLNGARQSIHAKNPDGSDGGLERFCASVANRDPISFMKILLSKCAVEHDT